jgi:Heparinase II/III N-terminus/Heparinase II/III-like protein
MRPLLSLLLLLLLLPAGPALADTADTALHDTFTLQGITAVQPRRADGGFDWDWRGPRDDPEWAWFFNRHGWFPDLARAARDTGDPRYAAALVATLDDWIATHPAPGRISFSAAWRPLEAARRVTDSWLPSLELLRDSTAITPAFLDRVRSSLAAHGEHLRHHHAFGGNHLVTEMLALVHLALAEPDLPGASGWLDYGLATLDRAYDDQVYPDGTHKELSTLYQRVVALDFQRLVTLLEAHRRPALAAAWRPRVERLWRYLAAVRQPDGANPLNNDSDHEDLTSLLAAHAPALAALPPAPATHFPWAGQTIFRTGDQWAFFDAGPRGTAHDHADSLQFSLSLGAAPFLVDNGRYTYSPGPWRDYFAGPAAHNILLLDGHGAAPAPRTVTAPPTPAHFLELAPFALAWGDAHFATPANPRAGDWRRIVVRVGSTGWVVIDRIVAFGSPELQTLWHWAPTIALTLPNRDSSASPLSARSTDGDTTLAVWCSSSCPAAGRWSQLRGVEPPAAVQGWFSPRFNFREPAPCAIFSQRLRGPATNLWIFQSDDMPKIEAINLPDGEIQILYPSGYVLILSPDSPSSARLAPTVGAANQTNSHDSP